MSTPPSRHAKEQQGGGCGVPAVFDLPGTPLSRDTELEEEIQWCSGPTL